MPLSAGARLGPYEVLDQIGAGGMGEVYRARDTRLDRTVALKVLRSELSGDDSLRARFEREARAISALTHPHICTLHDVGAQDGQAFLVMEHLLGETLLERLKKGSLPLPLALEVATQIAEALEAAHKHGIVHRDLKPGNVMLTKAGAKLLDFGLASLAGHGARPVVGELTSAPTASAPTPLTGRGTIMGTLPYMAPEQLEGRQPDARTDLWALGAIVHEMVTGRRAFEGASQVSLIGAILEREPAPLSTLQPLTPPSLERLTRRCLAKAPDDRWDTAHDVADELRWIAQTSLAPVEPAVRGVRSRRILGVASLVAAGAVLGTLADRLLRPPALPPPAVVRSLLDVRPAEDVNAGGVSLTWLPTPGGSRNALAWTPDGSALVFVAMQDGRRQLYVRELDRDVARPLASTDGAQLLAVSPDGQWVAFWATGALLKVPLGGGPAAVVVEGVAAPPVGIAWGASGDLFYPRDGAIWRAPADGAPAAVTTPPDAELSHSLPFLLPGGRSLLYTVRKRLSTWGDEEVVVQILATGARTTLLHDAVDARYVPSGHLVFQRRGTLFAVAFDASRLEVRGSPVALMNDVAQALTGGNSGDVTGAGQFSVASTGALAYVAGAVVPYRDHTLVSVDRHGQVSPLPAPARSYAPGVGVSPDGRRLAVVTRGLTEYALWIHDVARGTLDKLSADGETGWPRWTPDGRRAAFSWLSRGRYQLATQSADGSTPPEGLGLDVGEPSSWSPDGRQLALVKDDNIWVATLEGSKASFRETTHTPHRELWPEFSPDGRWLAYGSNVSGRFEVFVQPYPGPGPKQQVSIDGGASPAWSPAGRELFFVSPPDAAGKRRMMVVDVGAGASFSLGTPRPLFEFSQSELAFWCVPVRCYGLAPDGQRFFVTQVPTATPPPPVTHIHLVQNWLEEVKARVPSAGR